MERAACGVEKEPVRKGGRTLGQRRPTPAEGADDRRDLAALGYREKLDRTLGSFSAFAAGFSYLSILTGIFQLFHQGFGHGGPAFFWTWPMVFLGQLTVALCFAELAAQYPLSGGVYQWSKYVASEGIGWLAGWVYLASLVISISAVALALQVTLPQIAPWFQLIGEPANPVHAAQNAVLLGCLLIAFTTLINLTGVGLLARINNLGVFAELIGASLLILLMALHARRSPAILFDTQAKGGTQPWGYLGPFFTAALMASYVMYGFDTAGSLAEETVAPRWRAPRAILQALAAAALAGALLMLFTLMAAGDFGPLADANAGLPYAVKETLGGRLGTLFLCDVIFAITVCALAVHTATVRLMFAMARDNNLPLGAALARVSPSSRTPPVPVVAAGLLAAGILVVNLNVPGFLDLVAPVAVLWANLAYLLVTGPLLYRRLRGRPAHGLTRAPGLFGLGRWGLAVNVLAVAWGCFMVVNMGWPRPDVYGEAWYQQYGAFLITGGLVAVGLLYYALVQRHQTGILDDHQAEGRDEG
jgi:urea carboxylase system permease